MSVKNPKKEQYIIFSMIYLTIILIGVVILITIIVDIYQDAQENIQAQIESSSIEISNYVDDKLNTVEKLAEKVTEYINQKGNLEELKEANQYVKIFEESKVFENVSVIDSDGRLLTSNGEITFLHNKEVFQRGMKGETFISAKTEGIEDSRKVIVFCAPIKKDNEIMGIVIGTQLASKLSETMARNFYGGAGFCYVVQDDGELVINTTNKNSIQKMDNFFDTLLELAVNKKVAAYDLHKIELAFKDHENKPMGIQEIELKDGKRYIGYRSVPSYPSWNVICVIKATDVWQLAFPLIIKTSILTITSVVAVFFLNRNRKKSKIELEKVAFTDELTEGWNYNYFKRKAKQILESNQKNAYTLIRIGIQNFKYYNNNFGYKAGDTLLKELYKLLNKYFSASRNELVARIHSDEFIILCHRREEKDRIEALYGYIGRASEFAQIDTTINFHIGVYNIVDNHMDIENMIERAQLAQNYYKSNPNEHGYMYEEKLFQQISENAKMETDMHNALRNKEFQVYYQPKIDLKSNRVVGGEALVRWNSKRFGFLLPGRFIPLFESNGFIQELDFYVLEQVCQYIQKQKQEKAPSIVIAVNQSRHHSYNKNYLDRLRKVLDTYKIEADGIELEITESMMIQNMDYTLSNVKGMRNMGFGISIDDFGTGYTSLRFLQEVEVDVVKIDRSMVLSAEKSEKQYNMFKSLVKMLHSIGVKVVCEGIETEQQLEMVQEIECDIVQGFYYAKPMPQEEFEQYIQMMNGIEP